MTTLRIRPTLLIPFLAGWLLGCSGGEANRGAPPSSNPLKSACTPDAASIQTNVFATSCNGTGCHGADAPAVGLNLADVSPEELGAASSALCSGWALVVPGSPEKSFLYQKLTSSMPACGEAMPLGSGQLTQADMQCVADWIRGMATSDGCETCGGTECVALASDALHCGSCNNACPDGVACQNGACACPSGSACSGTCVDTSSDPTNCGGCGNQCSPGSTCVAGHCSCPATLQACGATCADLQSDGEHCGDCTTACGAGQVCLTSQCADGCGPLQQCGTSCVDTQTSLLHCGGCDQACPGGLECMTGQCTCPGGATSCGSSCVDLQTDAANCGECGQACGAGEACVAGACQCSTSVTVSFKANVAPILDAGCTAAGCHTGVKPKEGLDLNAAKSYAELVNVAASQCGGGRQLVVPGSPSTSYLMQKLLNVDVCVGSQMPKAGQSLPTAELEAISGWICAGAPNN